VSSRHINITVIFPPRAGSSSEACNIVAAWQPPAARSCCSRLVALAFDQLLVCYLLLFLLFLLQRPADALHLARPFEAGGQDSRSVLVARQWRGWLVQLRACKFTSRTAGKQFTVVVLAFTEIGR
jgi:hypothetical protein